MLKSLNKLHNDIIRIACQPKICETQQFRLKNVRIERKIPQVKFFRRLKNVKKKQFKRVPHFYRFNFCDTQLNMKTRSEKKEFPFPTRRQMENLSKWRNSTPSKYLSLSLSFALCVQIANRNRNIKNWGIMLMLRILFFGTFSMPLITMKSHQNHK